MNRLSALAACLALLFLLAACGAPSTDEEQIRQRLDDMVEALAESNARAFMAPIAEDFGSDTWNLDLRGVRLLLQREMRAHERLRARLVDVSVQMHGEDRASAEFNAILTGGSGLIPHRGGWYQVKTGWRRDGNDWMLISASWEEVIRR